jgi:nucleotide-binding universal stress UspA family protein
MMAFLDIMAMLLDPEEEEPVIAAASALAAAGGGHANALLFEIEAEAYEAPVYIRSELRKEISSRAHRGFLAAEEKFKARLAREGRRWTIESMATAAHHIAERAAGAARCREISVLGGPLTGLKRRMFEGVLFGSGRPLIVMPQDWKKQQLGRSIVIGWNDTREAARALAAAMPLLEGAQRVTIVTVLESERVHGDSPAEALAAHLARCGFSAGACTVGRGEGEVDALLMQECARLDADLFVMGGYGRARLQEIVFGGVTRTLTGAPPLPLFMAH